MFDEQEMLRPCHPSAGDNGHMKFYLAPKIDE